MNGTNKHEWVLVFLFCIFILNCNKTFDLTFDEQDQRSNSFYTGYKNSFYELTMYCQNSNIRRTLAGNKIVDHSDVVGASPLCAAPTTSSFTT